MTKKIAFVGCGHIHTPAFVNMVNAREGLEVAAVWDHDTARAQMNAEKLHSKVNSTAPADVARLITPNNKNAFLNIINSFYKSLIVTNLIAGPSC